MSKSLRLLFIVSSIAMILSACSSHESGAGTPKDDSLSSLKKAGVIRVGSTPTGPPFSFLNPETNKVEGIMVDVAKKVGENLGIKVEIQPTPFSSLIPSIQSKKINMISAGMLITDERKRVIDFSVPVLSYGEALVVLKNNNEIKQFDDLKGKKVGAQEGTVYLNHLKEYTDIKSQGYKSIADMISELEHGRIDAFFGDAPIVQYMLKQNPNFNIKIVEDYKPQWIGNVGIGFPKGSKELQSRVNSIIEKMQKNGELDAILKKWGIQPQE